MLEFRVLVRKIYFKLLGAYRLTALIAKELQDDWTILDIGCGRSSPLKEIKKVVTGLGWIFMNHIIFLH